MWEIIQIFQPHRVPIINEKSSDPKESALGYAKVSSNDKGVVVIDKHARNVLL
ncbi:hypothetical protein OHD16_24675 [Sphingobacterium sp. ML3W]|uniref:hypothetical protein n=1 Tax=Sphingobacterium sp. ML3W TaxID=1538644 RepID=UPI00249BA408|nr:hypothetical protein [Sphingobacterium sp. ML3W]WFA77902.1 hypothetical protein OGI71_17815 [Sphingobacterium sp. ML3W]